MKKSTKTRKRPSINSRVDVSKDCVGSFFLDSGAHSLYTRELIRKGHREGYAFYETQEFWDYVDLYARFVKENLVAIDFFANVDVIFNPEISWRVLKYLEEKHRLNPVPVIHWGTDLKWLDKHLEAGYTYIGLGGLGQEVSTEQYYQWADSVYQRLCPPPHYLPIVKTHGFAMTGYDLLVRYPWYSVDSASWVKAGGFGHILVPHKRGGKFVFTEKPYSLAISEDSPAIVKGQVKHYRTMGPQARGVVLEWLKEVNIPLGSVEEVNGKKEMKEWGVVSHHSARKIANLRFYSRLCQWLQPWPWPYKPSIKRGQLLL